MESLPSHICLTVYPYNLGKPDNVAKPPKRSLAERAAHARVARTRALERPLRRRAQSMEEFSIHRGRASEGPPASSRVRRARILGGGSQPARAAETIHPVRALERLPRRTRRTSERRDERTRPSVPVNFPSSHSRRRRRTPIASRSTKIDAVDARALKQRSRLERSGAIRRRRVTNDPFRDVPRSIDVASASKKKYAFTIAPPRSRSYLVRTRMCARVRGGVVSGCGKVRRRASGRRRPMHQTFHQVLNTEAVLSIFLTK